MIADPVPRRRILVVDDHALLAQGIALELGRRGFEVQATSGPTAAAILAAADRFTPSMVLLDLHLGDAVGGGVELIGPLAACGSRVLVLTGVTDEPELARCLEAGAAGVIGKDRSLDDLVDAVLRLDAGDDPMPPGRREELLAAVRADRSAEHGRLAPFARLTGRERVVLSGLMAGASAAEIADASFVSLATVRTQIRSVHQKLDVGSQLAAVALAHERGWPGVGDWRAAARDRD